MKTLVYKQAFQENFLPQNKFTMKTFVYKQVFNVTYLLKESFPQKLPSKNIFSEKTLLWKQHLYISNFFRKFSLYKEAPRKKNICIQVCFIWKLLYTRKFSLYQQSNSPYENFFVKAVFHGNCLIKANFLYKLPTTTKLSINTSS